MSKVEACMTELVDLEPKETLALVREVHKLMINEKDPYTSARMVRGYLNGIRISAPEKLQILFDYCLDHLEVVVNELERLKGRPVVPPTSQCDEGTCQQQQP